MLFLKKNLIYILNYTYIHIERYKTKNPELKIIDALFGWPFKTCHGMLPGNWTVVMVTVRKREVSNINALKF